MTDERPSEVLGGLPRTRPHRRSEKRAAAPPAAKATKAAPQPAPAARPLHSVSPAAPTRARTPRPPAASASRPGATKRAAPSAPRARQPAQPPGTPSPQSSRRPIPAGRADLISSAVHVSAELAELGLSAGARALRGVVARLPKP
jgi:hypothetical protein